MTPNVKNPFASRTIWGAILVVLGLAGRTFGFDVPKDEITGLIAVLGENWEGLLEIAGTAMVVWGRFSATRQVGFKDKS